ncbi:MFS general substrate transporter [Thozetella sp. PMI_491]|nr:MFS general substrate transporter [Thozetella sp. PMI_491]
MAINTDIEKTLAPETTAAPPGDVSASEREDLVEPDEEFTPPDGGFVAWSQVFATLLVNMMSWGLPATFGVYQLYYRDTLKLPQSQVSWIGSVQVFLTFAMCSFSGRLADAGYVRSTLAGGSFLVVFGTFMTSLGTEYWHFFLAQGVCIGLGLGTMFMPPLSVAASYFKRKRTLALACSAMGTGLGSIVFPAIIQYLIPRVGFPWAVRCSGFVALLFSITAFVSIKPRLKPRKAGPLVEWSAFREPPYLIFTVGAFLLFWALYFGFFYINVFARNIIGFSTTDSVQLLLITNGMSVPARPVCGYLADWYTGPINMYIMASFLFGVITIAWTGVRDKTGMYVFTIFYGIMSGVTQGVFVGSLASLTNDPRKMGTRFGMVCTVVAFASLAGPPTAGAIIDHAGGSFTYAQVWAGLVIISASLLFSVSRCTITGLKLWRKI